MYEKASLTIQTDADVLMPPIASAMRQTASSRQSQPLFEPWPCRCQEYAQFSGRSRSGAGINLRSVRSITTMSPRHLKLRGQPKLPQGQPLILVNLSLIVRLHHTQISVLGDGLPSPIMEVPYLIGPLECDVAFPNKMVVSFSFLLDGVPSSACIG